MFRNTQHQEMGNGKWGLENLVFAITPIPNSESPIPAINRREIA